MHADVDNGAGTAASMDSRLRGNDDEVDCVAAPTMTTDKKTPAGFPTGVSLTIKPQLYAAACSGRAAFACATIALKAASSCIAMSARTFRSSSMPASLQPCMNCE